MKLTLLFCLITASAFGQMAVTPIWSDGGTNRAASTAYPLPVSITGASGSTTAVTGAQATKTVASAGTPELLAATTTLVDTVELQGKKARGTANTGIVYFGFSATNDAQLSAIPSGGSVTLVAPAGKKIDLNLIYIDVVTAADGVTYTSLN